MTDEQAAYSAGYKAGYRSSNEDCPYNEDRARMAWFRGYHHRGEDAEKERG